MTSTQPPERHHMTVIESADYAANRKELQADPIVCALTIELFHAPEGTLATLTHDDGSPNFAFMQAVNREYAKRGGNGAESIGAVAHAILANLELMRDFKVSRAKS
ncbi:hypothetical protein KIY85_gp84 [Mycobacterium phage Heffalump]|uniref:Uncharacterized protein n=1 Tax=Mycobacterium phage Heffalump TaxID=1983575 RepID=A0A220NSI4_9CAUD|nr:hypothetical protein KIY85_gp84 [Mycobacterium phage Heffalump]ASJ79786.1 hypothetical protein SEA_HEFFALUMP_84 [Mycobacterium phage Heffalump]